MAKKSSTMFTIEAMKTLKRSGSLVPSSKFLVQKMTQPIVGHNKIILEFGTGNGVITTGILNKITTNSQLISFELNKTMYQNTLESIPIDNRLQLVNTSALEFDNTIKKLGIKQVDYFISSLPLSLLKEKEIQSLLKKVKQLLNDKGMFIQYQYSLGKYSLLRKKFSSVSVSFTPFNFPPAFIYYCQL